MSISRTYNGWWVILLVSMFFFTRAQAQEASASDTTQQVLRHKDGTRIYGDSAIWQGMLLKVDIGNLILELATSSGKIQSAELMLSARLKNRYYPALELGYANAYATANGGTHQGQGGFARLGLDINGLKKHPESPHALLVGVRVCTSLQSYTLTDITINDPYWQSYSVLDFEKQFRCDVWGEVVAGCQVSVWEGFYMGWYARLKVLFTRKASVDQVMPYYVPGFGYRDDTNWGMNYYLGWKF